MFEDNVLKIIEKFKIHENKEQFLNEIGINSKYYNFMKNYLILKSVNKENVFNSYNDIENYLKIEKDNQLKKIIKFIYYMFRVENHQNEYEKLEFMEYLNTEFLNYKFKYQKPYDIDLNENFIIDKECKNENYIMFDYLYYNIDYILKKIYESNLEYDKFKKIFNEINLYNYLKNNIENKNHNLIKKIFENLQDLLNNKLSLINFENIDLFINLIIEMNQKYLWNEEFFLKLSRNQLELIKNNCKNIKEIYFFWKVYFNDKFLYDNINLLKNYNKNNKRNNELIELLNNMLNENYKIYSKEFLCLKDYINLVLLELSLNNNDLFIENFQIFINLIELYIEFKNAANITEDKITLDKNNQFYNSYFFNNNLLFNKYLNKYFKINAEKLLFKCLKRYLIYNNFNKILKKYFNKFYLKSIYYKYLLFKGEYNWKIKKYIKNYELNNLINQKILLIKNLDEKEGNLTLKIKNIKNIVIKVFEIDTNKQINLNNIQMFEINSLIPSFEYKYKYEFQSYKIHNEIFNLEFLKNKEFGAFIIQILGDKLNSTVSFTKGKLFTIYNKINNGLVFKIYNHNNNLCKGNNTGILINENFYKVNKEGEIFFEYGSLSNNKYEGYLKHENFIQNYDIIIPKENYIINSKIIINPESLINGNLVKTIIFCKLFQNNLQIDIKRLKYINLNLIFIKENKDEIIKDYKLKLLESQIIEFLCPPNLKNIRFLINASIILNNKEETILQLNEEIFLSNDLMKNLILMKNNNNFELHCKGLNGESIANEEIQIEFFHKNLKNQFIERLKTNKDGIINLNNLENIEHIQYQNLNLKSNYIFDLKSYYDINNSIEKYTIYNYLDFKIFTFNYNINEIIFFETKRNFKLLNEFLYIKDNYFYLKKEIKKGKYLIYFKNINKYIFINIKVDYIKLDNYNYIKNNIINYNHNLNNKIFINNTIENENNYIINYNVDKFNDSIKCYLITYNYLNSFNSNEFQIKDNINDKFIINENYKRIKKGYINDELFYVYQRKNKEYFLGNNLDKPGLLLKREFIKETELNQENLNNESDVYLCDDFDFNEKDNNNLFENNLNNKKNNILKKYDYLYNPGNIINSDLIKIEKDQIIIPKTLVENYNYVNLIIENESNYYEKIVINKFNKIKIKDLRLKESKEKGTIYSFIIKTLILTNNQNCIIDDLSITKYEITKNLNDLFEIIKLILKINKNNDLEKELNNWKFLCNWNKLDSEKKLEIYEKYYSHELNLFLFFKDKTFFIEVIYPFLLNKKEKDLIDNFLTNQNLFNLNYKLKDLNGIELFLYCYQLKENNNLNELNRIYSYINDKLEIIDFDNKIYEKNYNIIFNKKQEIIEKNDNLKCNQTLGMNNDESLGNSWNNNFCFGYKGFNIEKDLLNNNENIIKKNNIKTNEYKEIFYYYKNKNIEINEYWKDWIKNLIHNKLLITDKFLVNLSNISNILLIFATINLNFDKNEYYKSDLTENNLKIESKTNLIIFSKIISEIKTEKKNLDILINQFFYLFNSPENKIEIFEKGKIYFSEIIATNITNNNYKLQLINQIPQGSIPIKNSEYIKVIDFYLNNYETKIFKYYFYFPEIGTFNIYPSTITYNNKFINCSYINNKINVVNKIEVKEKNTINNILSIGNKNDIINFIKENNIRDKNIFNFNKIYFLLDDKNFYWKLKNILDYKIIDNEIINSFSIVHGDLKTFKNLINEYIENKFEIINNNNFILKEYYPLINSRVFEINENNILNVQFNEFYNKFIKYLFFKNNIDSDDYIIFSNYLLLQEKYEESRSLIKKVNPENITMKIQYDYIKAYLNITLDYPNFEESKNICINYVTYPILNWRNLFTKLVNEIAYFEENIDLPDINNNKENIKKLEEYLNIDSQLNNEIIISYKNLSEIIIEYYIFDLEVKFSLNPFKFNYNNIILFKPNYKENILLKNNNQNLEKLMLNIKPEFKNKDVYMRIISKNLKKECLLENNNLVIILIKEKGLIKVVSDNNKKLPKTYVKCFAKYKNCEIKFYKDGFTDLSGVFDFIKINNSNLLNIDKFAIFINNKEFGNKIIYIDSPPNIQDNKNIVVKLISKNMKERQKNINQNNQYNIKNFKNEFEY